MQPCECMNLYNCSRLVHFLHYPAKFHNNFDSVFGAASKTYENHFEAISIEQLFCIENRMLCSSLFSLDLHQSVRKINKTSCSC